MSTSKVALLVGNTALRLSKVIEGHFNIFLNTFFFQFNLFKTFQYFDILKTHISHKMFHNFKEHLMPQKVNFIKTLILFHIDKFVLVLNLN